MEQNKASGSGFLKVTGILMIIGGSISIIVNIVAILGIEALAYLAGGAVSFGLLYFAGILLLVASVAELVAGIIGVVNCDKPEKANVCIVWGAIVAALCVVGTILEVVGGVNVNFITLVLNLVLPVLYIVGAVKNKNTQIQN